MRYQMGLLCISMLSVTAQAGVVVHMADKQSGAAQAKDSSVVYAQDGFLRVDDLDDQGQVVRMTLFRDGAVWRVEVTKRTFQKYDKNAMGALQGGMQAQMQAALQNMPPEKRAMYEARIQAMQQKPLDVSLSDAGRGDRVDAYSCEVWQMSRNGKPSAEYCVAAKGSLPGGDELVNASHKAAAIANDVLSAAPQFARAMPPIYILYGKMEGFPVMVRHLSAGRSTNETILTKIERQSLPADKFQIPQGFTETQPGAGHADD